MLGRQPGAGVRSLVGMEVAAASKAELAHVTAEWFLASVRPLVDL